VGASLSHLGAGDKPLAAASNGRRARGRMWPGGGAIVAARTCTAPQRLLHAVAARRVSPPRSPSPSPSPWPSPSPPPWPPPSAAWLDIAHGTGQWTNPPLPFRPRCVALELGLAGMHTAAGDVPARRIPGQAYRFSQRLVLLVLVLVLLVRALLLAACCYMGSRIPQGPSRPPYRGHCTYVPRCRRRPACALVPRRSARNPTYRRCAGSRRGHR
jgi:hypothetical protein